MPLQEAGRREAARNLTSADVVVGHVGYPLREAFPVPPVVFTFLREPVDRALSNFSFLQNHPPSAAGIAEDEDDFAAAAGLSIGEFLCTHPKAASRHLGSLGTWFLTRDGLAPRSDLRSLNRNDLDLAKRNLQAMDAFGLVERMPESLLLVLSAIRAPARSMSAMPDENRQGSRVRASVLDEATLAAIRDLCALDLELYDFAQGLFEERLAELRTWASSWLPEFWLSAPESVLAGERALAALREELFDRLVREREDVDQLRVRLGSAETELLRVSGALARAEEDRTRAFAELASSSEEQTRIRGELARAESAASANARAVAAATVTISAVRSSLAWRLLETLRGLVGRRWNL